MGIAQTLRQDLGLELDLACESLDDGRLANPSFTHEHRRICTFAMAEYLDNLSYIFAAPDDRRQLVLTRQLIQANAEVLKIRRKLIPAPVLLLFFLVAADPRRYLLHHHLAIGAQSP